MFSYLHHIGDFNKATRHLSRVERSIYRDLIELYYETEKPLLDDLPKLCRLVIAHSKEEKLAVQQILNEFFHLRDGGYIQIRCELEIEKYFSFISDKSKAGKVSAERRKAKRAEMLGRRATDVEQVLNTCATDGQQSVNRESTDGQLTVNRKPVNRKPLKDISAQAPLDTDYPDWFEDIWKHYPTRAGGDNKKIAFQKAGARLKEGKTTDELYAAVDRYKYFVVATGKVSTEYVKQAATFFGSMENITNLWVAPGIVPTAAPFQRKKKFNPVTYLAEQSAKNGVLGGLNESNNSDVIEGVVVNDNVSNLD